MITTVEKIGKADVIPSPTRDPGPGERHVSSATAFGCPRNFMGNRFVYALVSGRARGLSIGINMNPDKQCNFDCIYCEVDRSTPGEEKLDIDVMSQELERALEMAYAGGFHQLPYYQRVPTELLQLRHVALSGNGEPTLSPSFYDAVEAVIHLRSVGRFPFFKIVLLTNATGLDSPQVARGLELFTPKDEIWAKLDAGTEAYMKTINRTEFPLKKVLSNILALAQHRPVIIQSLFPSIHGQDPPPQEIEEYVQRLVELKQAGAQISLVQIYSAWRPTAGLDCGHLRMKTLSYIARRVRAATGLEAEVF